MATPETPGNHPSAPDGVAQVVSSGQLIEELDPASSTDVVFALAGGMERKSRALELYRLGKAQTVVLSVGRFEIRRFHDLGLTLPFDLVPIARGLRAEQRHCLVTVRAEGIQVEGVPPFPLGTLREIMALATWLKSRPQVRSIMLVSSDFHLLRVRICCQAIIRGNVRLKFAAAQPGRMEADRRRLLHQLRLRISEILKFCLYAVLLHFKKPTAWESLVPWEPKDGHSNA